MNQRYSLLTLSFAVTASYNSIASAKYKRHKLFSKLLLRVFVFLVMGGAKSWGQTPANGGFEATINSSTNWTTSGTAGSTNAKTGVNALIHTTSSTSNVAHTNISIISIPNNNYAHVIGWAIGSNANARASCGGTLNVTANSTAIATIGTTLTRLAYDVQNTSGSSQNFSCRVNTRSVSGSTTLYWDDIITYTSTSATADLIKPNPATVFTIGTTTASSIGFSWTNGSDPGGTGIQHTIILRTTNLSAATPAMNDQGLYSTAGGASGPNIVSTDWTVLSTNVSSGSAVFTDNTVSSETSYKYAVIHRDLAYNYSTALVSGTIVACAGPSITSATAAVNPICSNGTTTLTANVVAGTDAAVKWWTATSGTGIQVGTGNTSNPVGPGAYFVYVQGTCGTAEASVIVGSVAAPTANAGTTSSTICSNGTYVVAGSSVSNNASIAWTTTGDGTFAPDDNSSLTPTYTPGTNDKSSGTVTITLTAVGNSLCGNATSSLVLTINALPPSSTITVSNSTCQLGCTVGGGSFTITPCTGSIMTFYDDASGTNPRTTAPVYQQETAMTIFYACVDGTTGCRSAIQTETTVPGTCTLPGAPTGSAAQTVCTGSTVAALTATGNNIQWYSFSSGGAALSPGTPLTTATIYYASQKAGLCESTARFAVTVTLLPAVNYGSVNLIKVNHLVISQVYGGGGNAGTIYKNDFIEIFNPTASTISVAGWSVQYASSAGSSWTVTNLSGTIAAGKYYLVQQAAGAGGTTNLPTPDAIGAIAMSTSAGKVALVNTTNALSGVCPSSASIIDLIGYGSGTSCSETAVTASLTNTTAAIRADAGCTDLNNNSKDFSTAGAPTPRNSAIAANICPGTSIETICSGSIPGSLNTTGATGGSGTFTYQWYSRSGNSCPSGTNISGWTTLTTSDGTGFNTITFTPSLALTSTTSFACLVTPAGSPFCGVPTWGTGCRIILVNSVTGGTIAAAQTICPSGDPVPFSESVASTGGGTLTYQWQSSTVNDFSSAVTTIPSANSTTYDAPSGLAVTTYYRRITTSTLNTIACTANSNIVAVIVSAGPEINSKGLGINIPDGSTSTILSNGTDFGSTSACLGKTIRTFTIENSGVSNLVIPAAGITLTGTHAAMFAIDGITLPATIEIGSSTTFAVTFDPSSIGLKTATVNIANNDCNENPYDFAIQGTGVDPEIDIKGNSVSITDGDVTPSLTDHTDFGSVLIGTPFARTYTLSNRGTSNLTIGAGAITTTGGDASMFVVSGITLPATIIPTGSATFVVTFTPASLGLKTITLNIVNDDCDENPYNFSIQGTGLSCSITRFGAGSNIQAVCPLSSITNITYTTVGVSGVSFSGLPAGVTGNWASNTATISGTPTASGTFNYIVTLTGGGCGAFSATGTIIVNPLPTLYNLTGGGAYCITDMGIAIGLSGSQSGVNYQLRLNAASTGAPKPGTGSPISFGPQGGVGTYTVVATNSTTGCAQPMTGSVAISTFNCAPSITDPCTCLNNATTLSNGQFGETVTVNGPAGQTWTVTAVTGLYATASPAPPLAPMPILVGATMTEGPAGVYNLTGKHIDAIGYTITVNNGLATSLSIGNLCKYPNPVITGLAPAICANGTPITLTGTPGDANIVRQSFTINGVPATQFTPSIPGTYTIGYTVNGGSPKAVGLNDPGCTQTVTQSVTVITSVTGTILGNSNTTICAGQSSDINLSLSGAPNFTGVFNIAVQSGSGIATPVFNFTATTNGASSITIPAGNLTNTSSSPVTYKVTWISLSDLSGCPVSSLTGTATIIVYPVPTLTVTLVNAPGNICPGTAIVYNVTNPNAVPGSSFSWIAKDNNGTGATLGSGSNVAFGNAAVSTTLSLACPTTHVNPIVFTFTPVGPVPLACMGTPLIFLINVRDLVAPVLKNGAVLPANQTNVNACKAGAPISPTVADIKALYTDNCTADANLVVNQTVNTVTGDYCNWTATYTFTIKDACNNITTVTIMHTGKDLTPPGWNITAGSLNRTVEYCDIPTLPVSISLATAQALAPTGTDNCGGAVIITKTSGVFATTTCTTAGIITNIWTIKDACNNTSPILFTQVITIVDTKGPAINGAVAQELNTGSSVGCTAILPNYILGTGGIAPKAVLPGIRATDCASLSGLFPAPAAITYVNNMSGANRIWQSPAPGVTVGGFGGLIIPVTIFAQDACGNISQVTFNVTAVDQTKPIVRCHPITVTLNAAGTAFITPSMLDGNGSPFPAGVGTATAPLSLSKDSCSAVALAFTFTSQVVPTATPTLRNFNCSSIPNGQQSQTYNVEIIGTDALNNSDVCTAVVTVVDNTRPVFTVCPTNNTITLNKDAGCAVTLPDFKTGIWAGTFVATDACGPVTYTQSPAPGSIFLGNITLVDVIMTATDAHLNTTTLPLSCTTRVILKDNMPPQFVGCPASPPIRPAVGFIQAAVDSCSITYHWSTPTLTDNCTVLGAATITSIVATGTVQLPDLSAALYKTPGSWVKATFFVGTTTITYTARDFVGNISTCSFVVTVYDATAPVITCPSVGASPSIVASAVSVNMNSGCGWIRGVSTSWDATATDNCLLSRVTYNLTRQGFPNTIIGSGVSLSGVTFTGVTVVTWSATDFSGNVSTCSFTVTVVDNQAPTIQCPPNVTAMVNAMGCSAVVPASLTNLVVPGTADNCAITLTEWDVFGATPVASGTGNIGAYTFSSGVSTVQYRVRDAANNIVVCTFTVNIGSGVTGTVNVPGGTQTVGLNTNPQPTVIFTGAGSASAPGTQQYTYRYNISVDGGPVGADQFISTAVGSNVVSLVQPNNALSTFRYTLLGVTDGQQCGGTVATAPNNATTIAVVVGTPNLTAVQGYTTLNIAAGGTIDAAITIKNTGIAASFGEVKFSVDKFQTGVPGNIGILVISSTAGSLQIGPDIYTFDNANWTVVDLGSELEFRGMPNIAPNGSKVIGIRFTRTNGIGNNGPGTNGIINWCAKVVANTGGDTTPSDNNTGTQLIKN